MEEMLLLTLLSPEIRVKYTRLCQYFDKNCALTSYPWLKVTTKAKGKQNSVSEVMLGCINVKQHQMKVMS